MEKEKTATIDLKMAPISSRSIEWVNHCIYTFDILTVSESDMAIKVSRGESVLYAERIALNTPETVIVPENNPNEFIHGTFLATKNSLTFNGNLEQNNLVLTAMVVGLVG